nr:MAG TPA: hypothetical protein [Caudoviricetes sp.]DAZ10702.1 MAG TPA: hypothetical protein [Caudoviricetes sp.]
MLSLPASITNKPNSLTEISGECITTASYAAP